MSNSQFTGLIEAIRKYETNNWKEQWRIGDELLVLAPMGNDESHNNSQKVLEEASKHLHTYGYDYSVKTLQEYREISHLYSHTARLAGVNYSVHRSVRDANLLARIVETVPPDKILTKDYAIKITKEIEEINLAEFHRKRDEERDAANAELEAAKEQLRNAVREIKSAKNEEEKRQAEEKKTQAQEKVKAARERLRVNRNFRPTKEEIKAPPPKEAFPGLTLSAELKYAALQALKFGVGVNEVLENQKEQLHQDSKIALMEIALKVHEEWLAVVKKLRGTRKPNAKRTHLSVIKDDVPPLQ